MFTIGRFARLNGVSAKRLRHYHRIGLFEPAWVDPATGYRHYLASQIPELRRIAALVSLGIPLATLCELRDGGADLDDELRSRRDALERERRRIDDQLDRLDIRMARSDARDVVERVRPAGHWAAMTAPPDSALNPMFLETEEHVRALGRRASRPPVSVRTPSTVTVMIPVTEPIDPAGGIRPRWTPRARVATTLVTGGYDDLPDAVGVLRRHVGPSDGEVWVAYLRFGAEPELDLPEAFLTDRASELVTEIQIEVG